MEMKQLLTPEVLGPVGALLIVVIGMTYKFLGRPPVSNRRSNAPPSGTDWALMGQRVEQQGQEIVEVKGELGKITTTLTDIKVTVARIEGKLP